MKILLAQINPTVADLAGNCSKILNGIERARKGSADLVVFPELALSGYPPEDFLLMTHFQKALEDKLEEIVRATSGITVIVGVPRANPKMGEKYLCNSAAVIQNGTLIGFQDKSLLPTYDVFDERRYFEPSQENKVWELNGKKVGITICEDIWEHSEAVHFTEYSQDPVLGLKDQNPDLLINLSASPYRVGKFQERFDVCSKAAKTLKCPVLLCNQIGGNDSLIFDGYSIYVGEDGKLRGRGKGFVEDDLFLDLNRKIEPIDYEPDAVQDLHRALVLGLRDYFKKSNLVKACFGLSGGIDSAVVACIAAEALGKENVLAVMMPSRYSSESSVQDAENLIENLGIESLSVSIEKPFESFLEIFKTLFDDMPFDETEENIQARIRANLLMAISNKLGHIVLSTGNKSELAMGYSTLYGDMSGGLGVLSDVTKMDVYALARCYNLEKEIIPWNIIDKPPSAELRPNQKDSDNLPDYETIDKVLHDYVVEHSDPKKIAKKHNYSEELVFDLIRRIHRNEYKRRQSPPGLRVSQKAFSVGRRFPIVQKWV